MKIDELHVVFCCDCDGQIETRFRLPDGFTLAWWHPSLLSMVPPGQKFNERYFYSWLKWLCGRGAGYCALLIQDELKMTVHITNVFPADRFKHPFASSSDLFVGRTFTDPKSRRQGLASFALQEIRKKILRANVMVKLWYITRVENPNSVRVAKKNGLCLFGYVRKHSWCGSSRLGSFRMVTRDTEESYATVPSLTASLTRPHAGRASPRYSSGKPCISNNNVVAERRDSINAKNLDDHGCANPPQSFQDMKLQDLIPTSPRDGSCGTDPSRPPVLVRVQRILIADDDEGVQHLISSVLAGEGFDVKAASNGEQAWDELHRERYDLLVTNNEMPRLAGLELIKRIRKDGMKLPVILASGSLSEETTRDYPQLQIAAVIPKPFNIWEFLTIVRIALRESGREATADHGTYANSPVPLSKPQPQVSKPVHNHVLIVDDDSLVRGSLVSVLESEGYVVDEARNGIEAVNRAIEHTPDLVLLDLNMPHTDGWTTFSQLDRVTPLLPIIVITACPNQYKEAVRLGVDAFMEKPLNIPMLVRAIKSLTSEDEKRHVGRITDPAFVTQLLGSTDS